jgi:hypothetical protein
MIARRLQMEKRGPKTVAGKARVGLNAVRHGILSISPVIPDLESAEDWQEHQDGIMAACAPANGLEASLAERVALLLWRLRRVQVFETNTIVQSIANTKNLWDAEQKRRGLNFLVPEDALPPKEDLSRQWAMARMIPNDQASGQVIRYESHLNRLLFQTMHELEALQNRRKGQAMPLARLDVQIDKAS